MTAGESAYNMNHRATRANYIHLQTIHWHVIHYHFVAVRVYIRNKIPPKFEILKRMPLVDY